MTPTLRAELARVYLAEADRHDVLADLAVYPAQRAEYEAEAERLRRIGIDEATKAEGWAA